MKILILGAGGMLGNEVAEVLSNQDLIVADRPQWDLTQNQQLKVNIYKCQPEFIINCAAFTDVTVAEKQKDLAFKVNADGPLALAIISSELNIPFLHISTDYVFDGRKSSQYNENNQTHAINVYGQSKEQGEKNIIANCDKYYIIRTSWLFGRTLLKKPNQKLNFVDKMLELSRTQKEIKVVKDKFSKPTFTHDLAKTIKYLIERRLAFGIYHGVNEGVISWHGFAQEIFKQLGVKIKLRGVSAKEFFQTDIRPKNTALKNNKLPKLRHWSEALSDYLKIVK